MRADFSTFKLRMMLAVACGIGLALKAEGLTGQVRPKDDLFRDGALIELKLEIEPSALLQLEKENRQFVKATLKAGHQTYREVGVHLKGNGTYRPLHDRPNFTVKFNQFIPGQKFHDLTKVHLHNSIQDPSYGAGMLCAELFLASGIPAARMTRARLEFNGHDLGLYLLVEGINKPFLRRHFENDSGNLYELSTRDIDQRLDQDNGDSSDQGDLKALVEATKEPDPARRLQRMQQLLDVDRFMTFLALEMMTWHGDGYALNRNNCRIYHDPATDKMVFIPHGLDQMFDIPTGSVLPPMKSLLVAALLETSEGRRQFYERVAVLFTNCFRVDVLTNRIRQLTTQLRPVLLSHNASALETIEVHAVSLQERIRLRAAQIEKDLANPTLSPLAFSPEGSAPLTGWKPKPDLASTRLEVITDNNRRYLHIESTRPATPSWRLKVFLESGRYRFTSRARTLGVVSISDGVGEGAGLRISNSPGPRQNKLTGDSPWAVLRYDFEVAGPGREVELVCELRAQQGQAWFDLDSLRLTRQ